MGDAVFCRSATFATILTKGGHRQAYTGIQKMWRGILKDVSKILKSEVRPWKSDVRRRIREKYHSCGAKLTCATSKLTCAAIIISMKFFKLKQVCADNKCANGHPYVCTFIIRTYISHFEKFQWLNFSRTLDIRAAHVNFKAAPVSYTSAEVIFAPQLWYFCPRIWVLNTHLWKVSPHLWIFRIYLKINSLNNSFCSALFTEA